MFAKLATFKAFNRAVERRSAPAASPGNDNQPIRRLHRVVAAAAPAGLALPLAHCADRRT